MQVYANAGKSVAKRLFDSVLANNHIFLNEARWARLENKTPRERMNMDLKLSSKHCSEGYVIKLCHNTVKLNAVRCVNIARKTILQNNKPAKYF